MTWRKIAAAAVLQRTCGRMSRRIAHFDHHPFAVARFKRILHRHPAVDGGIAFRMKGYRGIRQILLKREVCSGHVHALEVKTGVAFQAIQNRGLNFFLRFHVVSAGYEHEQKGGARWWKPGHHLIISSAAARVGIYRV